jgi:hypothetical protein
MKEYCTQNDGDCITCSLVNYGKDCMNNQISSDSQVAKKRNYKTVTLKRVDEPAREKKNIKLHWGHA